MKTLLARLNKKIDLLMETEWQEGTFIKNRDLINKIIDRFMRVVIYYNGNYKFIIVKYKKKKKCIGWVYDRHFKASHLVIAIYHREEYY